MTAIDPTLPVLLEAERVARRLSQADLLSRLQAFQPSSPRRRADHAALLQAVRAMPPSPPQLSVEMWPALGRAVADLRPLPTRAGSAAGPVLLVCESRPFQPDLHLPQEALLGGLLAALADLGREGWLLRLARRNVRLLQDLLDGLPGRPAVIVSVDLAHPACLEALEQVAPVVKLAIQSTLGRQRLRVAHDVGLEAQAIASLAATVRADQIAFVGLLPRVAGRRRLAAADSRLLALLSMQALNRHVALPGQLQFWADGRRSLQEAGLLSRLVPQVQPYTLVVVSGPQQAEEVTAALADRPYAGLLCRYWSNVPAAGAAPILGADLDLLAATALVRSVDATALAPENAVLVPPKWHHPPR